MKQIKLQTIIDKMFESGINDLELNILNKNSIELGYWRFNELGYWRFNPSTILKIENNIITYYKFERQKSPDDYIMAGNKEKKQLIFDTVNYINDLKDNKNFIEITNLKEIYNIRWKFYNYDLYKNMESNQINTIRENTRKLRKNALKEFYKLVGGKQ
jgi:hypothetical protein